MFTYTIRRLMFAVPTLLVISFVIFALLDLAPNDPLGDLPLTIPRKCESRSAPQWVSTSPSSSATCTGCISSSSTNR